MSRIGNLPVAIPSGVEVKIDKGVLAVKGAKGELSQNIDEDIEVKIEDGTITVARKI